MKKTVIASTLAVSLGIAGYGLSGHEAHASETTNVDKAHLVDLAQHNPEELNAKPVQAGAYDIHFVDNGYQYNFTSNGSEWSWSYAVAGSDADYTESSSNQEVSANTQSSTQMYKLFQLQLLQKVVATAHQLLHTQHQAITTALTVVQ